ncbi:MAG: BrnA antitoxin family protein [Methylorubrum populi]
MTKRKASLPPLSDAEEAAIQAGIANDPDNPEISAEQFARMRPASEVLPAALYAALSKGGRPRSPNKRVQVTLRLDPDALAAFRETGPGWQGRINEAVVRSARKLRQAKAGG